MGLDAPLGRRHLLTLGVGSVVARSRPRRDFAVIGNAMNGKYYQAPR
jgi:hypothetical protein